MLLANQHLYYFSEDNARKCQLTLKEMYGHMKANVWVRGGGGGSVSTVVLRRRGVETDVRVLAIELMR